MSIRGRPLRDLGLRFAGPDDGDQNGKSEGHSDNGQGGTHGDPVVIRDQHLGPHEGKDKSQAVMEVMKESHKA